MWGILWLFDVCVSCVFDFLREYFEFFLGLRVIVSVRLLVPLL